MIFNNVSQRLVEFIPRGGLKVPIVILSLYLIWRLWRFTLVPIIWRREPKLLPYWIPYIGHTWDFIWHSRAVIDRGAKYFGEDVPFALAIGGSTTVILSSPHEVAALWRNTTGLSFDPFVREVSISSGIPEAVLAKCWESPDTSQENRSQKPQSLLLTENPLDKCYVHLQSEWFKEQFLSKEHLADMTTNFQRALERDLSEENFPLREKATEKLCPTVISVQRFTRYFLIRSSFVSFFGEQLIHNFPNIVDDYIEFEDESWKVAYQVPAFFTKRLQRSKERVVKAIEEYMALPAEETPDVAWLIRTVNTEKKMLGLTSHETAACQLMFIWGAVNNINKACFWTFAHIIADPELLATVRAETDQARTSDGEIDINILSSECPNLESAWLETLRVYDNASALRKAEKDCMIGNILIHKGDTVNGPFHLYLMNQSVFGENPERFNAKRFLKNPDLHRSKWYSPFGGGRTLCPGRIMAKREVFLFVAITLDRFDFGFELDGVRTVVPKIDEATPAMAIMTPLKEMIVQISDRV